MLSILIVRPGSTEFDAQGRIKGSLDIPLNEEGQNQVQQTVDELSSRPIEVIYKAPCQSATQTAGALAEKTGAKIRELSSLINLDHGLWHGKLVEELKRSQPKVYKRWQENPESICPPEGESVHDAVERAQRAVRKIVKKHRDGVIAIVVNEPLASMVLSILGETELSDLWASASDRGHWEHVEVEPQRVLAGK